MKNVNSISSLIKSGIDRSNVLRFSMIKGAWKGIAGKFHSRTEPLILKDGLLHVAIDNSILLHAMTMNKDEYIRKINNLLKSEYVVDIRYRVKPVDIENKLSIDKLFDNSDIDLTFEEEIKEEKEYKTIDLSIDESVAYLAKLSKKREEKLLKEGYKRCKICNKVIGKDRDMCSKCSGEKETLTINRF